MVHLANQVETGTTKFGSEYLLIAKDPKIAVKLKDENDGVKAKLLYHLQAYNDRGVMGNRNPNVLATAPKMMFMADLVKILKGAGVVDLEFMSYGMKLRDINSPESNAICGAILKQWEKLDHDAQNDPDSEWDEVPRNSVADVAMDCGWMDGIVMIGGKDRRLAANNMSHDSSTVRIHQVLTGLSDKKIGSAEIVPPFPSDAGDLSEYLDKIVIYSIMVRYIKAALGAKLGIPLRVDGMRLLFCSVARIAWKLASPGMLECLGGIRTELRVSGQLTPKKALRYVQRHFSRLHPGEVLKKVGHADAKDNVNVFIVPKHLWLGNLVKMLFIFKEKCVGASDAKLTRAQKVACADLISALGISNRDTEKFATVPIEDLEPENAAPEVFPWYWKSPQEAAAAEAAAAAAEAQAVAAAAAAQAEAAAAATAEAQAMQAAEWAATVARGEEVEWRVHLRSDPPKVPTKAGGAQHGPPLAPHLNQREPITRLNTPRRAAPVVLEQLRKKELKRMRTEVKWYRPRRGADASSRVYRRREV